MTTFTTDFNGFKAVCADFFRALPTAIVEEADAGLKCLQLHWLGCTYKNEIEEYQAKILLEMASTKFLKHEAELSA